MIEKVTSGQYPHDGVKRQYVVEISPTMEGIKLEKTHLTSYGGDIYAMICIPGKYSLVIESDRIAANARIAALEAQLRELTPPWIDEEQLTEYYANAGIGFVAPLTSQETKDHEP